MFPTTQNSATDLQAMLSASKVNQEPESLGGKAFLSYSGKMGKYSFGKDKENITGDVIVVNTPTLRHGWALWVDKSCTSKYVSFVHDLPAAPQEEPNKQGKMQSPAEARGFDAAFLDDKETIISFETSTMGGRKAVDSVLNALKVKSASGEANFLFPVITLNENSYEGNNGTVYNPVFKITDWMDQEGNLESGTAKLASPAEEEAEEEAQPKRRTRRTAA